ncbi:HAMP domain-containing sensor histidine kinase [Virgibacillus salexigens]|uniref:HAMP domain-containing sensor histidine kinase n=1 Tax=Virgibacillus TaxID=84406 RepID=UPI00136EB8BE|nr:HAMP domain-containing sensor histidine kinase [Virgibacillus salexigens]MYL41060.1 HAMP domain-containing protein [Virgibacillus massiliensis]
MFIKEKERIPLSRFWTSRYLLTLCIGLIVIAILSALWIRHTTLENRLHIMELLTEDMANQITNTGEIGPHPDGEGGFPERRHWMDLESDPFVYIIKSDGQIVSSNRPMGPLENQVKKEWIQSETSVQKRKLGENNTYFYLIKAPIAVDEDTVGWVMMVESENVLAKVKQEYTLLAIMIISLALLGWVAIYLLTRRLSRPIKEVAQAARRVQDGDYRIDLPENSKEEEVYELVSSFKDMANRLEQLESLRTQLLAGVTHELKTPVTSINGLLQAVNDDVVTGDEAKEFLAISLKETEKMRTMVEDLLAFNSFAANAVPLSREQVNVNDVVKNIVYHWSISQEEENMETRVSFLESAVQLEVDVIRLEQIITNLLNNAMQAMQAGEIQVNLSSDTNNVFIDIEDNGPGIPFEEQLFIFERFYRGEGKKYKTRGLGLGLSLSKMIAQAMNGDLCLKQSSDTGTIFRISLPK